MFGGGLGQIRTFASGVSEFFFGHCVVTLLEPPNQAENFVTLEANTLFFELETMVNSEGCFLKRKSDSDYPQKENVVTVISKF